MFSFLCPGVGRDDHKHFSHVSIIVKKSMVVGRVNEKEKEKEGQREKKRKRKKSN